MDKRHIKRQKIVQQLFASTFDNKKNAIKLADKTIEILKHTDGFDDKIEKYAKKYSVDKIARVDLSILRLALYELLIEGKVPPKVVINEAVDLAKELGSEKSPAFVNAVLGKIYEEKNV